MQLIIILGTINSEELNTLSRKHYLNTNMRKSLIIIANYRALITL